MRKIENPFFIIDYKSPEYFCNRQNEKKQLLSAIENRRNTTLLAIRRLGKTGLIKHLFFQLRQENKYRLLYIDILGTQNLVEFVKVFSSSIVNDEQKKSKSFLKKLSKLAAGMRGKIVFDEITGAPSVEINYISPSETEKSLQYIFNYLKAQPEKYVIAIDEFQQITNYPEKNVEALLRTYIQNQHKDRYIFSGSNKHLLLSIFSDYGRPFYASTEFLELKRLDINEYTNFIYKHFIRANKSIDINNIKEAIQYYDLHTYYIQFFFNKLFELKNISKRDFEILKQKILNEQEFIFYNYRNLLTPFQFKVIKAIAKEKSIEKIASKYFLNTYQLGQPSSVIKAVKSLIKKEMIYYENNHYKVYDVFFAKWLQLKDYF